LLTDFDCPDSAFSAPRRASTTTPVQALAMLNHRFSNDMAAALARRLESEANACADAAAKAGEVAQGGATSAAQRERRERQVQLAFQLVYARAAREDEVQAAAELIERFGLRAFCRALLNSNEFIHLE
jgi:hypothetical protein